MNFTLEINTENKYNNSKNKIQQKVQTSEEYSQFLSASTKPENS